MIALEVFGETPAMTAVAERLIEIDGASRVRMEPALGDGRSVVLARVSHGATDQIMIELEAMSVARADMTLMRVEEIGGGVTGAEDRSLIWPTSSAMPDQALG